MNRDGRGGQCVRPADLCNTVLDTSSARAERFYGRLGYRPFGALENGAGERPEGHRRVFLRKRLPHHREPVASLGV